ncbi:hypothetical protein BpHYR1_042777 [Brachionus plicatilis]|uniref:Uncharacterized protein n=1 Tax=Brachionus plicatilis TaxID=10195 RepID=A0A3M7PK79_BRAPC|nr:hypothetical protein BpHYR1_042777 [Brachionus plicatilis]
MLFYRKSLKNQLKLNRYDGIAVIQDNTVSSSSENVLVYQDTSDDVDSDIEFETLHRKRKRSKGQVSTCTTIINYLMKLWKNSIK